jgi:esterase/lipase superfamily enzyme
VPRPDLRQRIGPDGALAGGVHRLHVAGTDRRVCRHGVALATAASATATSATSTATTASTSSCAAELGRRGGAGGRRAGQSQCHHRCPVHRVRVFFATDRQPAGEGFGGARAQHLRYGQVVVSVPFSHRPGMIEAPSLWRLEFSENPRKHMVILSRRVTDEASFFASIQESVAQSERRASFLFVHGYNVSFDDAAKRTAQIAYDLDFTGAPVFYSWPSQAALEGYTVDENNVEWSQYNLKGFLRRYAQQSGADDIYLIAHSMGNRALTRAVTELFAEEPEMRHRFKEIILTAPDIDADVFRRDLAPKLAAGCDRITLYVSDGDVALLASQKVHGGYVRVGDARAGVIVVPGIETVDASGLDTSFMEHSYFAETGSVLDDLRAMLREGLRAAQRGLQEMQAASGISYWKFSAPAPR